MTFLYLITERFSSNDSTSIRVMSFCKILKELGHEVIVISLDEVEPFKINEHNGIKFISLRSLSNSLTSRVLNFVFFKRRFVTIFKNINKSLKIDGIFFYDITPSTIAFLKKQSQKKHIKLFHDSVEWYSPQQFKWGKLSPAYLIKDLLNRKLIDNQISVFAISKYLENHFKAKSIKVTRVPIMMNMSEIIKVKNIESKKLTLLYAGSPGKKDYLKDIIKGLSNLSTTDLGNVELNVFGVNERQLIELCQVAESTIKKCGNSLILHGRVSRDIVLKYMEKTDFTVLLRSAELRYAKAGFPTKVVESLAAATPVICNLTSDLGDYLVEGENCLIVENCTSASFEATLYRALALSLEERQVMCMNARITAENNFDYKIYIKQFKSFICEK